MLGDRGTHFSGVVGSGKSTCSQVVSWCLSILDIENENEKSKQQPFISLI